jgi:mannose-6-phosphate isomerase-like protein (cupin superfamily)
MRLLVLVGASLAVAACSPPVREVNDPTPLSLSATRALYESYATALRSHRREELADFYHPLGATIVFDGVRRASTHAAIASRYREGWQGPAFFTFDSLHFGPLGVSHVLVTGGFRWLSAQSTDTTPYIYLAVLENTAAGPRIRVEHETRRPPSAAIAQKTPTSQPIVEHWRAARLDSLAAVIAAGGGIDGIATELGQGSPFVHLLLRRTVAGEAELHEAESDLVHVRAGRALLTLGGVLKDKQRKVATGEFRAASIDGGATREVGPGDVLMIPPGIPHLWTPVGGEPFVYVIVKVPKQNP